MLVVEETVPAAEAEAVLRKAAGTEHMVIVVAYTEAVDNPATWEGAARKPRETEKGLQA